MMNFYLLLQQSKEKNLFGAELNRKYFWLHNERLSNKLTMFCAMEAEIKKNTLNSIDF
jgi:hypothetical protein